MLGIVFWRVLIRALVSILLQQYLRSSVFGASVPWNPKIVSTGTWSEKWFLLSHVVMVSRS